MGHPHQTSSSTGFRKHHGRGGRNTEGARGYLEQNTIARHNSALYMRARARTHTHTAVVRECIATQDQDNFYGEFFFQGSNL